MLMPNSHSTNGDYSAEVVEDDTTKTVYGQDKNHSCGMSEDTSLRATFCIATMGERLKKNVTTPVFVHRQPVVKCGTIYHGKKRQTPLQDCIYA